MVRRDTERIDCPELNDEILREMYVEYNAPCDRLVSDPECLSAFAEDYAQRTGQQVEAACISHRLLTLRKLGEAKGGLPRLRRA
ncbi:MAG TPA: hypothetical protein PLU87_19270 [Sedimentisphaerales bacterium]|nr:hypothetical protein [Sedimentisphaerales bacterium]HRS13239.1 hypothetical protein [Sedimentisphaerales bacterium]HRV49825.1 hypothetical protein [Sedimentisphaerales bacterium]